MGIGTLRVYQSNILTALVKYVSHFIALRKKELKRQTSLARIKQAMNLVKEYGSNILVIQIMVAGICMLIVLNGLQRA